MSLQVKHINRGVVTFIMHYVDISGSKFSSKMDLQGYITITTNIPFLDEYLELKKKFYNGQLKQIDAKSEDEIKKFYVIDEKFLRKDNKLFPIYVSDKYSNNFSISSNYTLHFNSPSVIFRINDQIEDYFKAIWEFDPNINKVFNKEIFRYIGNNLFIITFQCMEHGYVDCDIGVLLCNYGFSYNPLKRFKFAVIDIFNNLSKRLDIWSQRADDIEVFTVYKYFKENISFTLNGIYKNMAYPFCSEIVITIKSRGLVSNIREDSRDGDKMLLDARLIIGEYILYDHVDRFTPITTPLKRAN